MSFPLVTTLVLEQDYRVQIQEAQAPQSSQVPEFRKGASGTFAQQDDLTSGGFLLLQGATRNCESCRRWWVPMAERPARRV
jgi:hypothetical protein